MTPKITENPIVIAASCACHHFPRPDFFSGFVSSSRKKSEEKVSVFIPITMDSTNRTTPRRIGRASTRYLEVTETLLKRAVIILPSCFRTDTAYFSFPFIMTPSITACPPIRRSLHICLRSSILAPHFYINKKETLRRKPPFLQRTYF